MNRLLLSSLMVLLAGCGHTTKPRLLLTGGAPPPRGSLAIFFLPETDLVGKYEEKLAFFSLQPLTHHLAEALSHETIEILWKPDYNSRPMGRRHANFFVVVEDSASADLVVETGVDTFEYQSAESISDRLAKFWLLGFLSLGDDDPRGIIGATCRIHPTGGDTGLRSMEFDVVGVSEDGLDKSMAYQEAFRAAGNVFMLELLRDESVNY